MENLNKLFQDRNLEILKNNLKLSVERNCDALMQTINNSISLKSNRLKIYIKENLECYNIKYDEEAIERLIKEEKAILISVFSNEIDNRKVNIDKYVDKETKDSNVDDSYLEDYKKHIDDTSNDFEEAIEKKVTEEIITNFSSKLLNQYKFHEEEQKDNISSYIFNSYCKRIINESVDENNNRNSTLKNIATDSFEHFKDINRKTIINED